MSPLARWVPLRRVKPIRRVALMAGRRRVTGPSASVVAALLERAGYCCEVAGCEMGDVRGLDWSVHHRSPRQMGGTRDTAHNAPANLLIVCGSGTSRCHGAIEAHREIAYAAGWLVHRGIDPATVPVTQVDTMRRVLLGPGLRVTEVPA